MMTRHDVCSVCPHRIYVLNRLACTEIGDPRHLCGESALLPSPGVLEEMMADPDKDCPMDRWKNAKPSGSPRVTVDALTVSAQRLAFKQRAIAKRRVKPKI